MNVQPREITKRLCSALSVSSLAGLARFLDVSPQAINGAIQKRQIPEAWLYKVAYRTGRRVEWMQSGEGPEFASVAAEEREHYRRALPPALQGLIEQWAELSSAERSIIDNALKLLLSSDPETQALTVEVAERLLEQRQSPRQQRASAPPKKSAGSV